MPVRCGQDGCHRISSCAFPDSKRSRYCTIHKKPGMVVVLAGCCNADGCDKQPSFGFTGEKPRYCATHKLKGMTDVKNKRCEAPGCGKTPNFAIEGQKPRFCSAHKLPEHVNVKGPFCHVHSCRRRRALSRFCVEHLGNSPASRGGSPAGAEADAAAVDSAWAVQQEVAQLREELHASNIRIHELETKLRAGGGGGSRASSADPARTAASTPAYVCTPDCGSDVDTSSAPALARSPSLASLGDPLARACGDTGRPPAGSGVASERPAAAAAAAAHYARQLLPPAHGGGGGGAYGVKRSMGEMLAGGGGSPREHHRQQYVPQQQPAGPRHGHGGDGYLCMLPPSHAPLHGAPMLPPQACAAGPGAPMPYYLEPRLHFAVDGEGRHRAHTASLSALAAAAATLPPPHHHFVERRSLTACQWGARAGAGLAGAGALPGDAAALLHSAGGHAALPFPPAFRAAARHGGAWTAEC